MLRGVVKTCFFDDLCDRRVLRCDQRLRASNEVEHHRFQLLVYWLDAVNGNQFYLTSWIVHWFEFLDRDVLADVEDLNQPGQTLLVVEFVESDSTELVIQDHLRQLWDKGVKPWNRGQELCGVQVTAVVFKLVNHIVHIHYVLDRHVGKSSFVLTYCRLGWVPMSWRRTSPPVVPHYLQEPLDIDVFLVYVSQVVTVHIDVLLNLLSVLLEQFFVRAFEVFVVIYWDLFNLLACHNT